MVINMKQCEICGKFYNEFTSESQDHTFGCRIYNPWWRTLPLSERIGRTLFPSLYSNRELEAIVQKDTRDFFERWLKDE